MTDQIARVKMQNWNQTDQFAGLENAELENDGPIRKAER